MAAARSPRWTGVYQVNHFESLDRLLAVANAAQKIRYHKSSEGGVTRSDFIGRAFSSWEDCYKKAHAPWQDGIDIVLSMIENIEKHVTLPKPKSIKRRGTWSEEDGDEISVDRLRNGDAYWRKMQKREVLGAQTISVFFTVNAPANCASDRLFWRGVVAIVLTHLLENAGYRVELFAVRHAMDAYKDGDSAFMSCCLKQSRQPVDIASIANAVSGWFYRTIWMQAQYAFRPKELQKDLGISLSLSEENQYVKELAGKNKIIVIDTIYSEGSVVDEIRKAIMRIDNIKEKPIGTLSNESGTETPKAKKKKKGRRRKYKYYGDDS